MPGRGRVLAPAAGQQCLTPEHGAPAQILQLRAGQADKPGAGLGRNAGGTPPGAHPPRPVGGPKVNACLTPRITERDPQGPRNGWTAGANEIGVRATARAGGVSGVRGALLAGPALRERQSVGK